MPESLTIVIPMAGLGTRMRPHTWSKPKPLISVAGKPSLEHLLDMFGSVPNPEALEYVFIVSPLLGQAQVPKLIKGLLPRRKAHFIVQTEMKGQSHALWLAREHLAGPVLICFSDTLIEADFSSLAREKADGVVWVKEVDDPRRFGVAQVDSGGWISRLIEKPGTTENRLALVGCYYFRDGAELTAAIEEQMAAGKVLKAEYFLADAITIMIARGSRMRVQETTMWLDTGTFEATLEANRVLLERRAGAAPEVPGSRVIPPVAIHPTAEIVDSSIGPFASIGAGCKIRKAVIRESIVEPDCAIEGVSLNRSMIGGRARVEGRGARRMLSLNIGDDTQVIIQS